MRVEVYKRTPFGKRYIDVEVTRGGKTYGIETKVGGAHYTPRQRAKDYYLRRVHGYHVTVARTGRR